MVNALRAPVEEQNASRLGSLIERISDASIMGDLVFGELYQFATIPGSTLTQDRRSMIEGVARREEYCSVVHHWDHGRVATARCNASQLEMR